MPNSASDVGDFFSILSSNIRIDIVTKLFNHNAALSFGEIAKFVQPSNSEKLNLAYHLKKLQESEIIEGNDDGYRLTSFGQKIAERLGDFEHLLQAKNSCINVRTSRYTLEPFNEQIIEQKLILEAGMPPVIAKKISEEAKRRLVAARVTYLTAPLIREYINAILIENQMEDYRHKLTRLGLPPYDIQNMLAFNQVETPEDLRSSLGKSTLEQFVLLDQLSQRYADLLLSGEIVLTNLEVFGLSPLELVIPGLSLIEALNNYYLSQQGISQPLNLPNNQEKHKSIFKLPYCNFIDNYRQFLTLIRPFFPSGINIIRFDDFIEIFLQYYSLADLEHFIVMVLSQVQSQIQIQLSVSLESNFNNINPLFELFLKDQYAPGSRFNLPDLQVHCPKEKIKEMTNCESLESLPKQLQNLLNLVLTRNVKLDQFKKWGDPSSEQIFTNINIPVSMDLKKTHKPALVIEKISVNLVSIYQKAQKSGQKWLSEVEKSIALVYEYFELKCALLAKNLLKMSKWNEISKLLFQNNPIFEKWNEIDQYKGETPIICGISFHGLDEVIFLETGLYIKDIDRNREKAINFIDFLYTLLQKRNERLLGACEFALAESHHHKDIVSPINYDILNKMKIEKGELIENYSGFRIGFHMGPKQLAINHIAQIYQELSKSKYKNLVLAVHIEKEQRQLDEVTFQLLKTLINTNACSISIEKV